MQGEHSTQSSFFGMIYEDLIPADHLLRKRKGYSKAVVAVARKPVALLWHSLLHLLSLASTLTPRL